MVAIRPRLFAAATAVSAVVVLGLRSLLFAAEERSVGEGAVVQGLYAAANRHIALSWVLLLGVCCLVAVTVAVIWHSAKRAEPQPGWASLFQLVAFGSGAFILHVAWRAWQHLTFEPDTGQRLRATSATADAYDVSIVLERLHQLPWARPNLAGLLLVVAWLIGVGLLLGSSVEADQAGSVERHESNP